MKLEVINKIELKHHNWLKNSQQMCLTYSESDHNK